MHLAATFVIMHGFLLRIEYFFCILSYDIVKNNYTYFIFYYDRGL